MFLYEITSLLKKNISPKIYSLNSDAYGIQFGNQSKQRVIRKIMLTVDLNLNALQFAIKNKINLIITYYGLIIKPVLMFNEYLLKKFSLLLKNSMTVFTLNSSFIGPEGGITDTIRKSLFLELDKTFNIKNKLGEKVPIGRICIPKEYHIKNKKKPLFLEDLIKRIKTNFNIKVVRYVGSLEKTIEKVCIISLIPLQIKYLLKAKKYGCNCVITDKIIYNSACFAKENGINIIEIPHYKSILYAIKNLYYILSLEFPYDEFFLYELEDCIENYY
ncbi:MAG: Nif3-like dinuclear metal center hexameric protein [Promethearchaeota archaeon]